MTKSIEAYLAKNGYEVEKKTSQDEDLLSLSRYLKWFRERILRLDSEEYRREFWRQVNVKGYSVARGSFLAARNRATML